MNTNERIETIATLTALRNQCRDASEAAGEATTAASPHHVAVALRRVRDCAAQAAKLAASLVGERGEP